MGSGKTQVYQPQPPPQPSTAEAISAYQESLPAMLQTQLEFAPQFQQSEIDQLLQSTPQLTAMQQQLQQQYLPQNVAQQVGLQMQYAPMLTAQQQALQRLYEPEAYAAKGALGGIMSGDYMSQAPLNVAQDPTLSRLQGMMTDDYLTGYQPQQAPGFLDAKDRVRQDIRGAQATRGLAQSGFGAEEEARMMAEFEFPYAMQQEQMRLGELGRRQSFAQGLGQTGLSAYESALGRQASELGRRQNVGLSLAGRFNVPSQPNVQMPNLGLPQLQPTNLTQGFNPGNVMSFMNQGYGMNMQASAPYVGFQPSQTGQIIGGIASGIGAFMGSSKTFKKEIRPNEIDTIELLKQLKIVNFRYKPELVDQNFDKDHIGIIAEDSPDIITTEDKKYIDLSSICGLLLDVNKKLIERIEKLEVKNA